MADFDWSAYGISRLYVGAATDYALRPVGDLSDRVVKNAPADDERVLNFVVRYAEAIIASHRNRHAIDPAGSTRNLP
jgi:hypothetical protein